jgi:GTP-binding protein
MSWKIRKAVFLRAITRMDQAPESRPAVAFAGRSNVGKSSLINKLVGVRHLAKTSSTPGRTREIIMFEIDENFHFIDLPGYGYARAPGGAQRRWAPMMARFFREACDLRLVVILLDSRHTPTGEDRQMVRLLDECGHPYIFAVTKCDKLSRLQLASRLAALQSFWELPDDSALVPVSARTGDGIADLLAVLREALTAPPPAASFPPAAT